MIGESLVWSGWPWPFPELSLLLPVPQGGCCAPSTGAAWMLGPGGIEVLQVLAPWPVCPAVCLPWRAILGACMNSAAAVAAGNEGAVGTGKAERLLLQGSVMWESYI